MDAIELSLFNHRIQAICEEMGAVLRHSAISPNIRDRLDYSCALFDPAGRLCAQAAHIPVHLGSMAYAMADIVAAIDWRDGDMVVLNDPYLGGTHLPDVTLIAPLFAAHTLCGYIANRAHHADIGCPTPGSMPMATSLRQEGLLLPPRHLLRDSRLCLDAEDWLFGQLRNPALARADFSAQISANHCGIQRLLALIGDLGVTRYTRALASLNDYAERLAREFLRDLPSGSYHFQDLMDDDGYAARDIPIRVCVQVDQAGVTVDFNGTAAQTRGNINCPLAVTAAAVYYVFHCLMPAHTPACAGSLRPLRLLAPAGCLVNARPPAAVAAGNVETSSRIVDCLLGALAGAIPDRIPAASHGSMNNIALGGRDWDYYETLGGGGGAGPETPGVDAIQTHMTNTLNTPIEILEMQYPLRISRYAIREDSGGQGRFRGGNGLIREYEFLQPMQVTLLTERRRHAPWGLQGGGCGRAGENHLNGHALPGKCRFEASPGDHLRLATAGGGGWGRSPGSAA